VRQDRRVGRGRRLLGEDRCDELTIRPLVRGLIGPHFVHLEAALCGAAQVHDEPVDVSAGASEQITDPYR